MGYFIAIFIAVYRDTNKGIFYTLNEILKNDILIRNINDHNILFVETGNMMIGGMYSAIVQVKENITGLLLGESYLNYIKMIPPSFLGLPRPQGLEWHTGIDGNILSQGGIFEVAEAYWNFGFIGAFTIPLLISYFYGYLFKKGVVNFNYFYLIWFIVFGLHGFRSIWYQNFSYFRLFSVMMIIFLVSKIFSKWILKNNAIK